ncbi:MAG: hypothetical protein ACPGO3_03095 [Magnetospiraceae bacterium]
MAEIIEYTTPGEIEEAERLGSHAFNGGAAYDPPRVFCNNPWLENAWRTGFVRAKIMHKRLAGRGS